MNFTNIDPMIGQTLTQMIHLKTQVEMVKSVDTSNFLAAVAEFSNLLGIEMANQAMGKSNWVNPNAIQPPSTNTDMSAAVLEQALSRGD